MAPLCHEQPMVLARKLRAAGMGVEGFIRINSNAATLPETGISFHALWILTAVYMLTAWWVTAALKIRKD